MANITEALAVTLLGISVVFLVLIILMAVLSMMKLFAPKETTEKTEKPQTQQTVQAPQDDSQLIAVLMAAITAYNENIGQSNYSLNIKSYRRVSDGASAFSKASQD